jgi:putative phosphoesterase
MKIALLSDIHGNPIALDAVLDDARAQGVESYWALGDLVAIGPDPVGVLERLAELPELHAVRGNTERYVLTGEGPFPTVEQARQSPELIDLLVHVARSFAWTRGYLAAHGLLDRLAELPLERRATLPDGTRLLAVHAAPGTDEGEGLHHGLGDEELAERVRGCGADLVCVGHTHLVVDRTAGAVRVVNPGSVSNSWAPDLRASYAVLDVDASGLSVEHRRVPYDHDAVLAAIERSRHPAAEYIASFQQGERTAAPRHLGR